MNYTGNIPSNREEAQRAKSLLNSVKKNTKSHKTWHSNDLFYDEVVYTDFTDFTDERGLVYEALKPVEKRVIKKVPYFSVELPLRIKKSEAVAIFQRKYGFDKYKVK